MTARPQGRITRGTTAPNRLRRFDRWILHLAGSSLRSATSPLVVDLGFGASPRTLQDFAAALRTVNPQTRTVGVEIDPERVQRAVSAGADAVHGGFEIPVDGRPTVIRAANVLRQYDETEVAQAWQTMCGRLSADGWLVEGTCSEDGRLASFLSLNAAGVPLWFTISLHLADLVRPSDVAARLPKSLIHHNVPGCGVHELLMTLDQGWERAPRWSARQRWAGAVAWTERAGWVVRDDRRRWRLGEVTVAAHTVLPRSFL